MSDIPTQHDRRFGYVAITMVVLVFVFLQTGCTSEKTVVTTKASDSTNSIADDDQELAIRSLRLKKYKPLLSDYRLFRSPMSDLLPADGVFEYELNTPLFSDYSQKQRLVQLPPGTSVQYTSTGPLDFPVGTVIAKTFFYTEDINDKSSKKLLIETRILEHRKSGWIGIPYIWNEDQTEARLAVAGGEVDVSWKHTDGELRKNVHLVPNLNDCKRCHTNVVMEPIGPKANNLNRDFDYHQGSENQLVHWSRNGVLTGAPDPDSIPRLADWNDPSVDIERRARAYLDVNCAHCHNPIGPARNSGLHLNIDETKPYHLGTYKTPVAAGKGTGGRLYGIVPGKPDESILEYRMRTTNPGEIMPEFGKSLVHLEGLALIRQWILEMN